MQKQAFCRCLRPDLGTSLGAPFTVHAPHGAREARAPERGRTERCDALLTSLGGAPPPEGEALPPERRDEARRARTPLVRSLALVLRCVRWEAHMRKVGQLSGVARMDASLAALPCASCAAPDMTQQMRHIHAVNIKAGGHLCVLCVFACVCVWLACRVCVVAWPCACVCGRCARAQQSARAKKKTMSARKHKCRHLLARRGDVLLRDGARKPHHLACGLELPCPR